MVFSQSAFSPHTRGCSEQGEAGRLVNVVFPAYAGMFRFGGNHHVGHHRFPRIRGDVPITITEFLRMRGFSPHTRGCSYRRKRALKWWSVFPAYAGMFRIFPAASAQDTGFSPHTRGCSVVTGDYVIFVPVFPAYAGMFPGGRRKIPGRRRFPRIRGDVPVLVIGFRFHPWFSPHTRGCSELRLIRCRGRFVFPAYAGMFLRYLLRPFSICFFPAYAGMFLGSFPSSRYQ